MHWTRIYLGVGMAALSGVVAWDVWDQSYDLSWRAGSTCLAAVLFLCSGLYLWELHRKDDAAAHPVLELPEDRPPLLGELLVFKYRLVSVEMLERALAKQRRTKKLLGETLLGMGAISPADLEMVLKDQCTYKDGSWRCEPWARRPVGQEAPRPAVAAQA